MAKDDKAELHVHEADFCVVGGGMAGLCAALAAARHGAKVVLMQDRPVLGGNASSEIRMHICGADRHNHIPNMRETGILEELRLENLRRNPLRVYSVWDTVLYEKARYQENLTLLLNCTCQTVRVKAGRIVSVTGWQLTTYTRHEVRAKVFADCSGDAVLAPLVGADFRVGREARGEYGESHAPEKADRRTMGMSLCFHTRQYDSPQPFEPPSWACRFDRCEDLPYGERGHAWWQMGYWWVELGGEADSIRDTESLKDDLLKISYGVWDHIKNRCPHRQEAACWALDWMPFIPGKRESRRYLGDHVLSQCDIEAGGKFDDTVAYGGWSMDDHHPAGFRAVKLGAAATIFHPAPSPYGIPYRCLYSRNVENLLFAGRCLSATHMALSSTRVMGTCSAMGQAVGTAAAMAVRQGLTPREVLPHVKDLQQTLLRDDCYLPGVRQEFGPITAGATIRTSAGEGQAVRDGVNRPVAQERHGWPCRAGDWIAYEFDRPRRIDEVRLVLDSALHRNVQLSYHQRDDQLTSPPPELPKAFLLEGRAGEPWQALHAVGANHQRLIRLPVRRELTAVRFTLQETWGGPQSAIFTFAVD